MSKPVRRIQRKRIKGWKMPPNTVYVGRTRSELTAEFANPFRVGGYFKMGSGKGGFGFSWLQAMPGYEDASFTRIETNNDAVAWFKEYRRRYPFNPDKLESLRGKNLACWCPLDQPCHADVLLELANSTEEQ